MKGSVYSRGEVEKPVGSRSLLQCARQNTSRRRARGENPQRHRCVIQPGLDTAATPPTDQHHLSLTHCTLPYFCTGRQSPIGRLFPIGLFPSDLFPTSLFPFGLFPTGLFLFGLFPTGLFPVLAYFRLTYSRLANFRLAYSHLGYSRLAYSRLAYFQFALLVAVFSREARALLCLALAGWLVLGYWLIDWWSLI